jgi:hypothetical protein
MKIALHDNDKTGYPNLALMKLSALYKKRGHKVEWFNPLYGPFDIVFSSKIFTWTKPDPYLPSETITGGTGHVIDKELPDDAEHICPDYSLYGVNQSYGFLTRGCPNKCYWCFVPKKEGNIKPYADIEEFTRHKEVILMDNNVLAHEHGIKQIEKIVKLGLSVDFNQGLDARLIDDNIAKLLSRVKWLFPLRLACDQLSQMGAIQKAVTNLRWHNCTPRRYFVNCLVTEDINDAVERIKFLKGLDLDPFCQPYRDLKGTEPTKKQRDFARWTNRKHIYKSTTWEDYKPNKTVNK